MSSSNSQTSPADAMPTPSAAGNEIRGRGLMLAMELFPEVGGARQFCYRLAERGMLCKETHVDTIRLAPPLCITRKELDWAFERIEQVFRELD